MSGNHYLAEFRRSNDLDLSKGLSGWLRRLLDKRAQQEGQPDRHALFLPRVFNLISMAPSQNLVVLEIGCASGWAISYRHANVRYIAVDRGVEYRKELEQRGVEFHEADVGVMPLPLEHASVNLVILNHLIEHIPNYEFFIQEIRRVIRADGAVYIRTPDVGRVRWNFFDDYTHVRPFTIRSLDQLMSAFGFVRKFVLHSDHPRIVIDILTNGHLRKLLFGSSLGGKEIEAGYVLRKHA